MGVPHVGLESQALNDIACLATGLENGVNQVLGSCIGSRSTGVVGAPDSIGTFTVLVQGGPGPDLLAFTASASVSYEVRTIQRDQDGDVPEPSTWALIGCGLAGLAVVPKRTPAWYR